ncbi:MAG: hypothetical protein JNM13_01620 [Hyphomicrobiaceae bacterium]|nr:hypothetical protein [Hyphomicrobiaceae bacterium]
MSFSLPNRMISMSTAEEEACREIVDALDDMDRYAKRFYYAVELYNAGVAMAAHIERDLREKLTDLDQELSCLDQGKYEDISSYFVEFSKIQDNKNNIRQSLNPEIEKFRQWQHIAGREGAMTIYHFGITVDAFNKRLGRCPILRDAADRAKLDEANKLFRDGFKYNERIRHAVGHEAELLKTQNQRKKNYVTNGYDDGKHIKVEAGATFFVSDSFIDNRYTTTLLGDVHNYECSHNTTEKLKYVLRTFASAITAEYRGR